MEKIRIGVFGVNRGAYLAEQLQANGAEIVAFCDVRRDKLEETSKKFSSVAIYDDFEEFINHGFDAVVLANYFHEHASYAIRCLKKGIHVFSECISNGTMAEGVALFKAAKKSNAIYMLAENYPHMLCNREIKRIVQGGSLGQILYAEGEYNHPSDPQDDEFKRVYAYTEKHWRNHLPRTYYVTHSLAPLMAATGALPKTVSAHAVFAPVKEDCANASYNGDRAAIILIKNKDGSIFRVTGCTEFGGHENSYRVCGLNGQIENVRGMEDKIMLRYNDWSKPMDCKADNLYTPEWNDCDEELIKKAGHGGGDFLCAREFLRCVKNGVQPEYPYNVEGAVAMSSVAILAHRSVLSGATPFEIPDFSKEEDCNRYINDYDSPFYADERNPTVAVCSKVDFKPTETQLKIFREKISNKG